MTPQKLFAGNEANSQATLTRLWFKIDEYNTQDIANTMMEFIINIPFLLEFGYSLIILDQRNI